MNLVEHAGMFAKREIAPFQRCNEFDEIVDPLLATNEDLRPARITNEIWFTVLINSSPQLFAAKKARNNTRF